MAGATASRPSRPRSILAASVLAAAALVVFAVAMVKGASVREADEHTRRAVATVASVVSTGGEQLAQVHYKVDGHPRTGVLALAGQSIDAGDRLAVRVAPGGRLFLDSPWMPMTYTVTALGLVLAALTLLASAAAASHRRARAWPRWLPYEIAGRLRPRW